jgi:hypothetical protein
MSASAWASSASATTATRRSTLSSNTATARSTPSATFARTTSHYERTSNRGKRTRYQSSQKLLDQNDLDAVVICTPDHHPEANHYLFYEYRKGYELPKI